MPVYVIRCKTCHARSEIFRSLARIDDLPDCHCGGVVERVICAPAVRGEIEPYRSPGTNKWIESRAKQREDLRAAGAILYEPGLERDVARNREHTLERAFSPIAAGVDAVVSQLVSSGKIES